MYIWTIKGNLVFIVWLISTRTLQFLSIRKKCVVKNSRWELKVPGRQPRERVNTFSEKVPFHENRLFRKKYCSMKGVLYFFKKVLFHEKGWILFHEEGWILFHEEGEYFFMKKGEYFFMKKGGYFFKEILFLGEDLKIFSGEYFFMKKGHYFFKKILFLEEVWIFFQENTFS